MTRPGRYAPWRGRPAQGARLSRLCLRRAETQGLSPENAMLSLFYGTPEGEKESLSPGNRGTKVERPPCSGKSRSPALKSPVYAERVPPGAEGTLSVLLHVKQFRRGYTLR